MKTAGVLLIAAGILLAGREWERQKRFCVYELEYFCRFLQYLEQEIGCRQAMLPVILERAGIYARGLSGIFAASMAERLRETQESLDLLWEKEIMHTYGHVGLNREELRVMEEAGAAFALPEKSMIGLQAQWSRQCLLQLLEQRRLQLQKDCYLFRCLSIMASLFAVILLL